AHTLAPDDKRAILLINMEAMFQMIDSLFAGIDTLVWLIGLGTLLSGAIGVSNIMMVTVRERTAEIGIRRAIGARPRHILTQIMAESMVLTVLAGMSGIVFAVLLLQGVESVLLAQGTEASFQVSFSTAIGSTVALCLLGSAAGIAPSLRALAIKPIEAIRDE
ncbi:MAG: FtsX-like permease family protein, partial [Bacteroidaceae bacterium]|nr:FtsX-like permease family protein [Bacteroidaceae bacterium]